MDREKLNKAAGNHFIDAVPYFHSSDTVRSCVVNAFKQGADWLMQQPLSERLTDAEIKKIAKFQEEIHGEIMCAHDDDDWQSVAHYIMDVMPRTFADIFGADLFKEKNDYETD